MNRASDSQDYDPGPKNVTDAISRLHEELFDTLKKIAWAILRDPELAKDAAQESFKVLTEKLTEQPDGIPTQQRPGWLVKTVQFVAHNMRRKEERRSERTEREIPELSGIASKRAEDKLVVEEDLSQLAASIRELPAEQRRVVHLRFQENLSFAEIATIEEVSLNTVLSRMRLALGKLRKQMNETRNS